ncbi:MAG: ECF-type sigma factor [Pirellulales bacterium]
MSADRTTSPAPSIGEPVDMGEWLPLVYDELRKLAAIRLANDSAGKTLQPTALVHEVYLRLLGNGMSPILADQRVFFAAAAESMRRILIDRARAKSAQKRGGNAKPVDLDLSQLTALDSERSSEILALDEALEELATHDSETARLIQLRFGGLTHQQAAESPESSWKRGS